MLLRLAVLFFVLFGLLPCKNAQAAISLQALINEQPVLFILDTKTDTTVLFAHAAQRVGLKWTMPNQAPAPGRMAAGKSEECRFDIGSGTLPAVFAVVDVPQYRNARIDGVLSWNDMKGNIFLLDGERRQFSAVASVPEWAKEWQSYIVNKESGRLIMETEQANILIDTSSNSSLKLGPRYWDQWTAQNKDARFTLEAYSTTLQPVVVDKVFYTDRFKLGSFELENLLVQRDSSIAAESGTDFDVSLGLGALSRLIIVVDRPKGVCYVGKTDTIPQPQHYNRLGAVFVPENIQTSDKLVAIVADRSPAANAGIQNGDALVEINGTDITKWRTTPGIMPISRFWEQPVGTKMTLGIFRNGKPLTVNVTLADILEAEK